MNNEEILNKAFALGGEENESDLVEVYDVFMSFAGEKHNLCLGSWSDGDKAKAAMQAINENIKTADKANGIVIGLRILRLTEEERTEYLK